jgi:large subunit ribosomal protein L20
LSLLDDSTGLLLLHHIRKQSSSAPAEIMSFQFLSKGLSRYALNTTLWSRQCAPVVQTTVLRTFASKKVRVSMSLCVCVCVPLACSNGLTQFFLSFKIQHKNLLKHAKGFRGRSKNCFRIAIRRVHKSWQYGYRDRRRKKREWHKLWIQRIQAGVRQYSLRYSEFMGTYNRSGMQMDRKVLAELAASEPFAFRSVVQVVEQQKVAAK